MESKSSFSIDALLSKTSSNKCSNNHVTNNNNAGIKAGIKNYSDSVSSIKPSSTSSVINSISISANRNSGNSKIGNIQQHFNHQHRSMLSPNQNHLQTQQHQHQPTQRHQFSRVGPQHLNSISHLQRSGADSPVTSPHCHSSPRPSSSGSSNSPCRSPDSDRGSSSPATSGERALSTHHHHSASPASFVPRPGLLNLQHPSLVQSGHPFNLYQAHSLFGYTAGHGVGVPGVGLGGHNPMSMLSGSAFHSPADHALKLAQLQGLSYAEWLARTGMYVSRMVDYSPSCEYTLRFNVSVFSFHFFRTSP